MAFNNWACEYDSDPIDELYEPNIGIVPRSLEVGVHLILLRLVIDRVKR